MLSIDRLISHRFRGFSKYENTVQGLNAALDFGVQLLEFDIRVTRCGTPIIYHDEYALDRNGKKRLLSNALAGDLQTLGGAFAHMPSADVLFKHARGHKNQTAILLVDIKDLGFEEEINSLVHFYGLENRVVYVSWIPEVLYRLHTLAPQIPLCLSHWCLPPNKSIRAKHIVSTSITGEIPRNSTPYIHGQRRGWYIDGGLTGKMLEVLKFTKGYVCVPQDMITPELSEYYHNHQIRISTFSYTDWDHINRHNKKFNIDLYFIDNKAVFDQTN